jgi:hypothetical protein|tara:strand:+ start:823 stop:969 length:147 start_codon:yes stop_codon:yes gene_type:complete
VIDKAILAGKFIMSVMLAFSIRQEMLLQVMLGFLFLIGLKATKKVLND